MGKVLLYVPVAENRLEERPALGLPAELNGKRVGFLDNNKANADLLLGQIREALGQRFALAGVVSHRKPTASKPAAPETLRDLAECDLVINGLGD